MSLIQCPECDAQISDQATACPHCGRPATPAVPAELCKYCKVPLVMMQRTKRADWVLLITAPLALAGLVAMLFNFVVGAIIVGLAIIIDNTSRGKITALTCPKCGRNAKEF